MSGDADASPPSEDQEHVILDFIKTPAGTQTHRSGHSSEKSREGFRGSMSSVDKIKDAHRSGSSLTKPRQSVYSTVSSREGFHGTKSKTDNQRQQQE